MKRDRHDPIRSIKSLFDPITVMDINIDVQHTMMMLEQLQNSQDTIIHITKPRGLALLRVMQPPRPINHDIRILLIKQRRPSNRSTRIQLAELEKPIKNRAILPDIKALELPHIFLHVIRRDHTQKIDVVVGMETRHLAQQHGFGPQNFHVTVEPVVDDEGVGHADTVGLEGGGREGGRVWGE